MPIKRAWHRLAANDGVYIANEQFPRENRGAALAAGEAEAVAWGQRFSANPILPPQFGLGVPYNTPDPAFFYGEGVRGYTDYPALATPA